MKISKQYTNHDSKALDRYLLEISKVELISHEEEIELAKEIKNGNQKAFERLVNSNLRFVVSVAKQYQNQGLSLGDLINEGNIGLIKAARRFDETRGFKFISYAVWWIRQSIMQAIAEQSRMVRLPLNRVGALNKLSKAFRLLEQEYERKPTQQELAKELEIGVDDVADALQLYGRQISMDAPFSKDEDNKNSLLDTMIIDQQAPDTELMKESLKKEVETVLATLPEREAKVIQMYFGINNEHPSTLEEIGERFNLTRERVRQIKEKALRSLRYASRSSSLKTYLG